MYPEENNMHMNPPVSDVPFQPAGTFVEETNPVVPTAEPTPVVPPVVPPVNPYECTTAYQPPVYSAPRYTPPVHTPTPPKKKSGAGKWIGIIALCLCISLIGGVLGAAIYSNLASTEATQSNSSATTNPGNSVILEGEHQPVVITPEKVETGKVLTAAEVYATYVNSTVGITTSITTNYWGYQSTSAASGSGFIISEDGYIITNHHVIEDSDSISVAMYDGREYNAKLVGYDESNDLAILKVEATGLQPVILGKSSSMHVGDDVVAIGNPLGELTFSLTKGTVSALNRDVTMSNGITMSLIQTDCAINSGNSGGALFNMYGEVVGITNAKYSSSSYGEASIDNIGFASPIDDVRGIITSIMEKGYYAKPYIGVSVADVSEESQGYGLPKGASVREIIVDGPSEQAGLKLNDIITHVNGEEISGSSELVAIVRNCKPGDTMKLTVYRVGQTIELTLTVGEQVQNTQKEEQKISGYEGLFPGWGF